MTVGDKPVNGTYAEENKRAFHGFGNNLVRTMIDWIYGYSFDDVMTGYRAMSRPLRQDLPRFERGASRLDRALHPLCRHRWRIKDVPVEYRDRPAGSRV